MNTYQSRINERCILVHVASHLPPKTKEEKSLTRQFLSQQNARQGAGKFVGNLYAEETFAALTKQTTAVRDAAKKPYGYKWADGQYIAAAAAMVDIQGRVFPEVQTFHRLADELATRFDELLVTAQDLRNGMFDRTDYPRSAAAFRDLCKVEVRFLPLPDEQHIVLDLAEDEIRFVRENTRQQIADALANAKQELYNQIAEPLRNMVARLSDPKGIFRDSLVGNIKQLADLMPQLNITLDPAYTELGRDLADLSRVSPEVLRQNPRHRRNTAEQARHILAKLNDVTSYAAAA